jgi:hypothetical protein
MMQPAWIDGFELGVFHPTLEWIAVGRHEKPNGPETPDTKCNLFWQTN